MSILSGYDKENVFYFFEEICKIPHGSGNEKKISDYILNFGKERNLNCRQDELFNVVIKKEGTKGYENKSPIIFQSHIDMVCQKDSDVEHDFLNDGINIVVDGDFITANGTTLGADNGIGVAYMMALLDSKNIAHPPLEMIFTTEEETGLCGAIGLDVSDIKGKQLINLDTEEWGVLMAGCSGGQRVQINIPIENEEIEKDYTAYKLKVGGVNGGHSGADIILQGGNANCILARVLWELEKKLQYKLSTISGGTVDNAICREAEAVIFAKVSSKVSYEEIQKIVKEFEEIIISEYEVDEQNIIISIEKTESNLKCLSQKNKEQFINCMMLIPYGVQTMASGLGNIVESSNNIGIIEMNDDEISIHSAVRSSVKSRLEIIVDKIHTIAKLNDAVAVNSNGYPGWKFNPNSELVSKFKKVFFDMYNEEPVVTAIHAGLECGLFGEKIPNLDMISIGPEMYDVHTTRERVHIESTFKIWELVKATLKEL